MPGTHADAAPAMADASATVHSIDAQNVPATNASRTRQPTHGAASGMRARPHSTPPHHPTRMMLYAASSWANCGPSSAVKTAAATVAGCSASLGVGVTVRPLGNLCGQQGGQP
jgi:hypothetical protein